MDRFGQIREPELLDAAAALMVELERVGLCMRDLSPHNLIVPCGGDSRPLVAIDHESLVPQPSSARQSRALAKLRLPAWQRNAVRVRYNRYGVVPIGGTRCWFDATVSLPLRDLNQHPAMRRVRRAARCNMHSGCVR